MTHQAAEPAAPPRPARHGVPVEDRGARAGVLEAAHQLTTRGRAFVAGGLTASLCGVVLGERDLVQIGILVLLIPLVTVLVAVRRSHRLSLVRTLAAPVLEVGSPGSVLLELRNLGTRTGLLELEEHVPWALGQRTRFLLSRVPPEAVSRVRYPITADVRGQHELGPLVVRVADPFGMLARYRSFPRTTTVTVVPRVEPLPSQGRSGSISGSGDLSPHPFTTGSSPDATVREYRTGDDLRRVHWPTTARTGEMMVRHEEQAWQAAATILLDNRDHAHRGTGPDSSLERAVSATASVAVHLCALGYRIRVLTSEGRELVQPEGPTRTSAPTDPRRRVLEFLASVSATETRTLPPPGEICPESGTFVIAVLGALDEPDTQVLRQVGRSGGATWAIALGTGTWEGRSANPRSQKHDLDTAGWRTTNLDRGGSLPLAWRELIR